MDETTPPPSEPYVEALDLDDQAPRPLLDRPVRVVAAERLPVELPTGTRFVLGRFTAPVGRPVMVAGDHPARTRLQVMSASSFGPGNVGWVWSHSEETCTPNSGSWSLPTGGIYAHGPLWIYPFYTNGSEADPENPDGVEVSYYSEFTF